MDGTSARQLNHRQALICMFLRFPRDTVCTLCCLKSLCFSCCVSSGKTWSRELQPVSCGQWKSVESDVKTTIWRNCAEIIFHGRRDSGKLFRSYFWLRFLLPVLLICNYNNAKKCSQNWSHFWLQIFLCWAGSLALRTRHKVTATCVETLYSAFARAYKQGGMDGTSARQLNHRQALICMFLRFPRDTVCALCCLKSLCFSCCVSSGKTWSRELQPECCGQWKSVESDVKTYHLKELRGSNFPWPERFGEAFSKLFLASLFAPRPSYM